MNPPEMIEILLARRRELQLTQSELAQRAGVSRRTIIALESGDTDIGMLRFIRILESLGLRISLQKDAPRPTESELRNMFKDDDE